MNNNTATINPFMPNKIVNNNTGYSNLNNNANNNNRALIQNNTLTRTPAFPIQQSNNTPGFSNANNNNNSFQKSIQSYPNQSAPGFQQPSTTPFNNNYINNTNNGMAVPVNNPFNLNKTNGLNNGISINNGTPGNTTASINPIHPLRNNNLVNTSNLNSYIAPNQIASNINQYNAPVSTTYRYGNNSYLDNNNNKPFDEWSIPNITLMDWNLLTPKPSNDINNANLYRRPLFKDQTDTSTVINSYNRIASKATSNSISHLPNYMAYSHEELRYFNYLKNKKVALNLDSNGHYYEISKNSMRIIAAKGDEYIKSCYENEVIDENKINNSFNCIKNVMIIGGIGNNSNNNLNGLAKFPTANFGNMDLLNTNRNQIGGQQTNIMNNNIIPSNNLPLMNNINNNQSNYNHNLNTNYPNTTAFPLTNQLNTTPQYPISIPNQTNNNIQSIYNPTSNNNFIHTSNHIDFPTVQSGISNNVLKPVTYTNNYNNNMNQMNNIPNHNYPVNNNQINSFIYPSESNQYDYNKGYTSFTQKDPNQLINKIINRIDSPVKLQPIELYQNERKYIDYKLNEDEFSGLLPYQRVQKRRNEVLKKFSFNQNNNKLIKMKINNEVLNNIKTNSFLSHMR